MSAVSQIYAVLMALEGDSILLPNVAIAEVVQRERVQAPEPGAPEWFAGYLDWHSRRVPVISFELLNGGRTSGRSRRDRVAIVNSLGVHLPSGAFGVITQGYPHLVTLNRTAVRPMALRETDRPGLLSARVKIASQEALIPDLATIEADIQRTTSVLSAAA
ncbi:MAG TPA: chemotaxis protein CheW [Nevskiaceae bacterium]|nr:chemotaxis protein CheW [Nevskiaceae bacterium]